MVVNTVFIAAPKLSNGFTVANTAADNRCMLAAIGHQCCLLEPAQFQLLLKKFAKMHVSVIFN